MSCNMGYLDCPKMAQRHISIFWSHRHFPFDCDNEGTKLEHTHLRMAVESNGCKESKDGYQELWCS